MSLDLGNFADILELAINGSGTGVWDRDVTSGIIRYSRSWYAILGYEDAPASNGIEESYTRVHPDDLAQVQAAIQEHFDGKTPVYEAEHRIRCKDGRYKWVLSRGQVVTRDEAGRPLRMVGTTIDVTTARNLAEQLRIAHAGAQETSRQLASVADALAERTEELAAAHRIACVGGWRWDLENECLWFSSEAWWLLGQNPNPDRVTYEQLRALFHPEDYARAIDAFNEAVTTKTPVMLEYRILHPDGSIRDALTHAEPIVEPSGCVRQLRGTTQDITPYRRIEAALRESEDHYRHMVDLHPQIPWTAGPDGGNLEIGPQWLTLTGMAQEDAIPFGWIAAVHTDDLPDLMDAWQRCLKSGDQFDAEYRLRLASGDYGWVRTRAAARRDKDGRIIRWYGTMEDVTDRHEAEIARRASEALAFRVLDATGDAVIVCDRVGRVTFANSRATAMLALGSSLEGRNARDLFTSAHAQRVRSAITRAIKTDEGTQFELFWPPTDLWLEANLYVSTDDVSLFLRDISEKRRAQHQLNYAAAHDLMTGAANRATLFSRLTDRLAQQEAGNFVALFCLDLDYFKEINDAHGHPVGDALLKQVVSRLRSCLRAADLLARFGGDEFVIMQTAVSTPRDATTLAARILMAMQSPFEVGDLSLAGSLSIGISVSTLDDTDVDALYGRADRALYEAKTKARGSYRLFRPELQTAFDAVRHLRADIASALARDEFTLAFQPIFQLTRNRMVAAEALLRWHHPERGEIAPADFIPVAEESGQIVPLGAWVLRHACETARQWPDDVKVAVNLSPRQFELSDVCAMIRETLNATGMPATRLELEVTESVLLAQNASNIRTLQNLRDLGVTLVLDDFGTGYSSLSYLNTFKFDFVKIDKSFVSGGHRSDGRQPILEAIMGMTAALGLPATAEGIETEIQLNEVRRLGCDFAQGNFLSRPVAAQELPFLLPPRSGSAMHPIR